AAPALGHRSTAREHILACLTGPPATAPRLLVPTRPAPPEVMHPLYKWALFFLAAVGFRALCDGAIDTTTASGELVFHIFSALAQFERRLIQERTRAGLAAARARGRRG